jgi:hypothetical protein
MIKGRKRNRAKENKNQLKIDFTANVPIEIHIPRHISVNYKKDFIVSKKTMIELVKA